MVSVLYDNTYFEGVSRPLEKTMIYRDSIIMLDITTLKDEAKSEDLPLAKTRTQLSKRVNRIVKSFMVECRNGVEAKKQNGEEEQV